VKSPVLAKAEEELREEQKNFRQALTLACARGGASAAQLQEFMDVLGPFLKPGLFQALPTAEHLLRVELEGVAKKVEEEKKKEREGKQLHLAGDAAQDLRGRSVFLTTAQFGTESQLLDIQFPSGSMDSARLFNINNGIFARAGGSSLIDSYHSDSVAYHLKYGRTLLSILFLPDVCHRVDGILDVMLESMKCIVDLVSCLVNLFSSINRKWISGFEKKLKDEKYVYRKFPSPGQTRAWTGSYRVLEWCFEYLNPVAEYVRATYDSKKDPSAKFSDMHKMVTSNQWDDTKFVVVWLLRYCADLVAAIMKWQGRDVLAHEVFGTASQFLDFFNFEKASFRDDNTFRQYVLLSDDKKGDLYSYYKDSVRDKKWVKDGLIIAVMAGRNQFMKNWGVFSRVNGDEEFSLSIDEEGDVFQRPQLSFFALCSVLNPRERFNQLPPSRDLFDDAIPWEIDDLKKDKIYEQLVNYMKDDSIGLMGMNGDIKLFWKSLSMDLQLNAKYGLLSIFALRCLDVPVGSAEVERAVSAYNKVVTSDRLSLSDENIRHYVFIYANGNVKKKEQNEKRRNSQVKKQKSKSDDRFYAMSDDSFWPKPLT
jgi:hypothetical protein